MEISLGHLLSNEKTHDGSPSEMEEETPSDLFDINHDVLKALSMAEEYENEGSLFSFDFQDWNDRVYVAVGKTSESSSSMDALAWTLEHVVSPTTLVQLIHVFPVVRHIPSPLGMLPRNHVKPELVKKYMAQERRKRKELLQELIDKCSASEVKVDIMLIESNNIAKALVELIPILKISRLVLGTTESSLRKSELKRGNGIADQILQNAPDTCDIKIVCEGKEVINRMIGWSSPSSTENSFKSKQQEDQPNGSFWGMCFNF